MSSTSGLHVYRDREAKAEEHAGRVRAHRLVDELSEFGELDDLRQHLARFRQRQAEKHGVQECVLAAGDLRMKTGAELQQADDAAVRDHLARGVGGAMPAMIRSVVLLPLPFGPTMPTLSPRLIAQGDVVEGDERPPCVREKAREVQQHRLDVRRFLLEGERVVLRDALERERDVTACRWSSERIGEASLHLAEGEATQAAANPAANASAGQQLEARGSGSGGTDRASLRRAMPSGSERESSRGTCPARSTSG